MKNTNFVLIDRQYLRDLAAQVKYAHQQLKGTPCLCEYCVHGQRMGLPVTGRPAA